MFQKVMAAYAFNFSNLTIFILFSYFCVMEKNTGISVDGYGAIDCDDVVKFFRKEPESNKLAAITHFLHNRKESRKYVRDTAISGINKYLESLPEPEKFINILNEGGVKDLFSGFMDVPFPEPEKPDFTFIDLFAGMGGFRIAMQENGGKCVFSSEWNKYAQTTYLANFGEMPFGDITTKEVKSCIPQRFDVFCAGFPCQPFSIAGISKKKSLGRETGFKDKTQGTLFFDFVEIISKHRPKAFFLENVKNLVSHDHGNTFRIIKGTLDELGYHVFHKVMDGKYFVPQHRERIMIVGFKKRLFKSDCFSFPEVDGTTPAVRDILETDINPKYTLSDKLWTYLQNYAEKHKEKGNGFGYGLVDPDGITRTLSARYYKDGSEILIPQGENKNPRRLSPRECARLMGYPDTYRIDIVSEAQAYRQCGNSVVVPLITEVAKNLVNTLLEL